MYMKQVSYIYYFRDGQGSLVTTLTIHEVEQEDFKSYTCILIDDHFIQGSERTTIYLLQTGK